MIRFLLLSILLTILYRAVSRLWAGVVRGMQAPVGSSRGPSFSAATPQRSVQMARDPVCGTFVVPERAVALSLSSGQRLHFCSTACRDQYQAQRPAQAPAQGRTA